jgi:hypothetical protein
MRTARILCLGVVALLAAVLAFFIVNQPARGPSGTPAPLPEPAGRPWFADITEQVGLTFVHDDGPTGDYFMPQIMGSGAALLDFDNDGRLDLYLLQNAGPNSASTNRLYRQTRDGRFEDVSAGSGLDMAGYGMGAAIGDVNNDGWPDLLVTEYGGIHLLLNDGSGRFNEVTKVAGLDNPLWGTSTSFVDFDRDGWLDLVIVNYLEYDRNAPCHDDSGRQDFCGPKSFAGTVTRLYHNLGAGDSATPGVRFEDVTVASGLGRLKGPGLGVYCADFNGDRWPDLFIANDAWPNYLWINQRDGTFQEEAVLRGLAFNNRGLVVGNMGVAVGDLDGDGLFDVFVTHLSNELHGCWIQGPIGYFEDRTAAMKLSGASWHTTGFGAVMFDGDNDGAIDLALAAGAVRRPLRGRRVAPANASFWGPFAERSQLFVNDGAGRLQDVSPQNDPFCGEPAVARGLLCGDLDGDGGLDLVVTRTAQRARVFRNVVPDRGHWLSIRVVDPALGGRDAYGAEVTVTAGPKRWKRWVNPGYSYLCSNDPRAHFGLGAVENVDSIVVVWPCGTEEIFSGVAADRAIVLARGSTTPTEAAPQVSRP